MLKLRYSHSLTGESGYQLLADGVCDQSIAASVNLLIRSMRLNPRFVEEQYGWFWRQVERVHFVFGRIGSQRRSNGSVTLDIRIFVCSEDDCDKFDWQPFHLADKFEDDVAWEKVAQPVQFPSSQATSQNSGQFTGSNLIRLNWERFASDARAFFTLNLNGLSPSARRDVCFAAPLVVDSNPEIQFFFPGSNSGKPPNTNRWKVIVTALIATALFLAGISWAFLQQVPLHETIAKQHADIKVLMEENRVLEEQIGIQPPPPIEILAESRRNLSTLFQETLGQQDDLIDISEYKNGILHYLSRDPIRESDIRDALEKWIEAERMRASWKIEQVKRKELAKELKEQTDELHKALKQLSDRSSEDSINQDVRNRIEEIVNSIKQTIGSWQPDTQNKE